MGILMKKQPSLWVVFFHNAKDFMHALNLFITPVPALLSSQYLFRGFVEKHFLQKQNWESNRELMNPLFLLFCYFVSLVG